MAGKYASTDCIVRTPVKATPMLAPLREKEASPRSRSRQQPMTSPAAQAWPYCRGRGRTRGVRGKMCVWGRRGRRRHL